LRDSYAATIMPLPRCRIPILTVAGLIEIAALHRQPGGVIPSWLGNTHGCCHVTTNQIIPQSPRERSSVTVHAALSVMRGQMGRPEPRGSCALREPARPALGTEFVAIRVPRRGSG
jgi:hypothetical protein